MKGSLRQRSPGSWELTIDTGRDALGKRQRRFVTVQGTKAQAQRRLREFLTTLDQGIALPTEKMLLRDWLDRWMQEIIAPNRRQRTKERYQGIITRHIKPAIGHVQLTKLAPSHVQALESQLSAQGMAAEGVGLVHRVLSGALKHALRMEMVYRNPVSAVVPPRIIRQEPAPPDIPAVRAALDLAGAEEHYLYACIHLIAYTGMRRGEAMGLLWNNVDLDQGRILIEQSLSRTLERGLHVDPPKTNSGRRVVDLDAGTIEVMAKHREDQLTTKELMREMYKDHGKVFADPYGEWINPRQLIEGGKTFWATCRSPGNDCAELAPLACLCLAAKWAERRDREQATRACQCLDYRRHLCPFTSRLAETSSRGFCQSNGFPKRRQTPTYTGQPLTSIIAMNSYVYNLQQPLTNDGLPNPAVASKYHESRRRR